MPQDHRAHAVGARRRRPPASGRVAAVGDLRSRRRPRPRRVRSARPCWPRAGRARWRRRRAGCRGCACSGRRCPRRRAAGPPRPRSAPGSGPAAPGARGGRVHTEGIAGCLSTGMRPPLVRQPTASAHRAHLTYVDRSMRTVCATAEHVDMRPNVHDQERPNDVRRRPLAGPARRAARRPPRARRDPGRARSTARSTNWPAACCTAAPAWRRRTDSVFQLGSIAKVYTATLVMQLVDSGELDLDAPVVDVLPEFATADAEATKTITTRQLLTHTSGLTCDFNHDTGRGDDCLARYVEASQGRGAGLPARDGDLLQQRRLQRAGPHHRGAHRPDLGPGAAGPAAHPARADQHDDAARGGAAVPRGDGPPRRAGDDPTRPRRGTSCRARRGPYGGSCATAGDVVRLARMHLDGGTAPDGTRVLGADAVAAMQRREIDVPDKWTVSADGWGLGWTLYDWDGVPGYGHDGAAIGQYAYLRVVPAAGVAVALLTNGGGCPPALRRPVRGNCSTNSPASRMPAPFAPAGAAARRGHHPATSAPTGARASSSPSPSTTASPTCGTSSSTA